MQGANTEPCDWSGHCFDHGKDPTTGFSDAAAIINASCISKLTECGHARSCFTGRLRVLRLQVLILHQTAYHHRYLGSCGASIRLVRDTATGNSVTFDESGSGGLGCSEPCMCDLWLTMTLCSQNWRRVNAQKGFPGRSCRSTSSVRFRVRKKQSRPRTLRGWACLTMRKPAMRESYSFISWVLGSPDKCPQDQGAATSM